MANIPLSSIKFLGLDDRYTVVRPEDVEAALAEKANVDGAYEGMTVGNAEQVVSSVFEVDKAPYNFRTSGGSLEIGDRMNDTLVGGSIAWNQLAKAIDQFEAGSSVDSLSVSDGVATVVTKAATNNTFVSQFNFGIMNGHKYLTLFDIKGTVYTSYSYAMVSFYGTGSTSVSNLGGLTDTWKQVSKITDSPTTASVGLRVGARNTDGLAMTYALRNIRVHDLTLMFGSTIADYIYSLEQATAGAGVAKLKSWGFFTKDYYPYDAGTLQHVQTNEHKMVGFNAWDEEWELGNIENSTGENSNSSTRIRSKNYIPVLPGTTYYFKNSPSVTYALRYYDADKAFISAPASSSTPGTFTTPSGCYYLRFVSVQTTYNHDICINLRWDGERDGDYEAHKSRSYALDPVVLRGIPKLVSGELEYDGDTYESDGTVTRKYGVRAYQASDDSDTTVITDKTNTVYPLTTPTTETANPYTDPQIVDNWGTESYSDYAYKEGNRTFEMPVGHETKYLPDLRSKIESAPSNPASSGVYVMTYQDGQATYTPLGSTDTITSILERLTALENQ